MSLKYAILLTAIVILQIAAAIAGFSISACRSKEIITDTLTSLIESYDHNDTTSRETIDWIQSKVNVDSIRCNAILKNASLFRFQWFDNSKRDASFSVHFNWITRQYQCCGGKSPDDWNTLRPVAETGIKNFPFSCCIHEIDGSSSQCTDYFKIGCLNTVHEIVSNHVAMISVFALAVAVAQVTPYSM